MKKLIILLAILTVSAFSLKAQMYDNAIGVRLGYESGLTFKHFMTQNTAFEGLVSTVWRGLNVTGLYEVHHLAFDMDGLFWYYGGGAHLGFWSSYSPWYNDNTTHLTAGLDGILGLDYTFREYPVSISLDWKPVLNFIGYVGFWGGGSGLSVRYTF